MSDIQVGDYAEDTVTGFDGVVSGITETMYSCRRITLERTGLDKDNKLEDLLTFDEPRIEVNKRKKNFLDATGQRDRVDFRKPRFKNGDYVKDELTGFTGFVDGITTCLHGCRRIQVSRIEVVKGKLQEGEVFDEVRLIGIKVKGKSSVLKEVPKVAEPKPEKPPGGPRSVGMASPRRAV